MTDREEGEKIMLGIIIMGHGHFGSGMNSALQLIAGQMEHVAYLDFTEDKDMEQLLEELRKKIASMKVEKYAVLCDINGGTPYKTAVLFGIERDNVDIFSGINLPFLLELCLSRMNNEDYEIFIDTIMVNTAQSLQRLDKDRLKELAN